MVPPAQRQAELVPRRSIFKRPACSSSRHPFKRPSASLYPPPGQDLCPSLSPSAAASVDPQHGQDLCPSHGEAAGGTAETVTENPVCWEPGSWMDPMSEQPLDWTRPPRDGPLPQKPAWALHMVRVLQSKGFLPSERVEKSLELNLWSDCSGINSDMFALKTLGRAIEDLIGCRVHWSLYFACDSDSRSLKFADRNHQPKHTSNGMEWRSFESGQCWCTKHKQNHDMPRTGVDIYVGTYPCSPWSRRGKRSGFAHQDARLFMIGIDTISWLAPAVWVIEIGEMPSHTDMAELMDIVCRINTKGRTTYTIQTMKNLSPAWAGFPIRRSRLFICGWREDIGQDGVAQPMECLVGAPMAMDKSYLAFLGIRRQHDWSRVGAYPIAEELAHIRASGCACGVDPFQICRVHNCKCRRCGEDGLQCTWRGLLAQMIVDQGLEGAARANAATLSYINVLELHGSSTPQHPRQRIFLNLLALRADARPLNDTLLVADLSQNPPHGDVLLDGELPTLTTSSCLWSFQAGQALSVYHLAAMMGLDTTEIAFDTDMTVGWFRHRLGMAVHIANFGLALIAVLTPALGPCIGGSRNY